MLLVPGPHVEAWPRRSEGATQGQRPREKGGAQTPGWRWRDLAGWGRPPGLEDPEREPDPQRLAGRRRCGSMRFRGSMRFHGAGLEGEATP